MDVPQQRLPSSSPNATVEMPAEMPAAPRSAACPVKQCHNDNDDDVESPPSALMIDTSVAAVNSCSQQLQIGDQADDDATIEEALLASHIEDNAELIVGGTTTDEDIIIDSPAVRDDASGCVHYKRKAKFVVSFCLHRIQSRRCVSICCVIFVCVSHESL